MIKNKADLQYYINEDKKLYPHFYWYDYFFSKTKYLILKYLILLRKSEYALNCQANKKGFLGKFGKLKVLYYHYRMRKLGFKLGFQFYENVLGPGVQIYSFGPIIINPGARIGKNCTIYPGVVIGGKNNGCPHIGDNCFIGLGAKVLGGVKIGNNVLIAPNAVVVKDIPDNHVVGGVPAKTIKIKEISK